MAQVEIIAANLKTNIKNSVKKIIKRVCAYCRVSTDSEEQQTSYNSQIEHYSEQIKSNPDWEFVGIYADEGISGTQVKKRTEFQRMIDDALNGKIDIIIAKSISRFARNTVDTLNTCRLLREHNVDVYFEKENIHTLELDSEMFLTLYSAFAQAESESTSMNVKLGLRAKMKRGEAVGKCECYGYTWNKETKTLEINEEQAEVVRDIFNWYVSGLGSKAISRKLNELGILTYFGKQWQPGTVMAMITQEKYVGDLIGQKYYVDNPLTHKEKRNYGEKEKYYIKDNHAPIVSRDVWNKAQEIAQKRSKKFQHKEKYVSRFSMKYAFSSRIVCGFCGTNYVRRIGSKKKDGTTNYYWTCFTRLDDKDKCNNSLFIREELLEDMFIQIYNSMIKNKHNTKEKLLNAIKEVVSNDDYKKKLNKLNDDEKQLNDKLSKLIDMRLENYIDKNAYISKEREIKEQLEIVYEKKKEYESLNNENKNISNKIKEIEKIINTPTTLEKFDRENFENIVDKIIIGEIDENNNQNPNVVRFILKTGSEYKGILPSKNNGIKDVSLVQGNTPYYVSNRNKKMTLNLYYRLNVSLI